METVSIIIPIYNAQKYIEACLDSVIKQTYLPIEVILVDDGSSDASGVTCDNYAMNDQRISVYHRENTGVSASRNFGLEHAIGKYILFVDADDTIELNMIEKCVQLAESNKAELVISSFRYHIMEDKRIVENSLGSNFYGTEKELFDHWFSLLVEKEILNPPWNKFVRKDLLDANHIRFHEKYSICEDMAFSIQILSASKKTVLTGEMYYNYYLKSSGTLVFMFHENYFEALTNFYDSAYEYCNKFENNSKQLMVLNTLYMDLIIMYLKQICTKSHWDKKTMSAKMKEIGRSEEFLHALKSANLNGKKKLVCFLLQKEQVYLIYIICILKNLKIRKAIKEIIVSKNKKLEKVKYKIEDRMMLGSVYDNIMLQFKYNTPKLAFLYNVMIGQKHRMLYYKRLKKTFWQECTRDTYWEKEEKVANKETVWFCWLQGIEKAPDLVQRCLESIKKNMVDKKIIIIDQENLFDYVQFPDYIVEKWRAGKIGAAHFSDLIRLELLIRHGGYWIDATVFCTDSKLIQFIDELPIFMYSFYYFGFNPEIMEANSWLLYGTTNQNIFCLTREFLYHYWQKYDRTINYFIFHLFMTMALEYYEEEYKKIPIVSQVDSHILATYIFDPYDSKKYELLKMQTGIHKLSTRFDSRYIHQKDTFYDRIIQRGEF